MDDIDLHYRALLRGGPGDGMNLGTAERDAPTVEFGGVVYVRTDEEAAPPGVDGQVVQLFAVYVPKD